MNWRELAARSPAPPSVQRGLGAQCRAALLTGWADLAGAAAAAEVRRRLAAEGLPSPDAQAAAWLPAATYLRLHDGLADTLCDGDRIAFGELWLERVSAAVPAPARWGLRALGARRGVALLIRHWTEAWTTPPPHGNEGDTSLSLHFLGDPLYGDPTWRWMTALTASLASEWLWGRQTRTDLRETDPDGCVILSSM